MKIENVKPHGDYILVQVCESETSGSKYLMPDSYNRFCVSKVLAVGDGQFSTTGTKIPMTVATDEFIFTSVDAGFELPSHMFEDIDNDIKYKLIRQHEVNAILENYKSV